MTRVKISALPAATSLTGAEVRPIVQGGQTKSATESLGVEYTNRFLEGIVNLGSGCKGYTLMPGTPTFTLTLVDTRQQMVACYLDKSGVVTGVRFIQVGQGNYTADQNNRIGLYSQLNGVLTLVASTANDGDLWKGAPGIITKAFSTPVTLTRGTYYVGYLYNNSAQTTAPTISGISQVSSNGQLLDLTNSNSLCSYIASVNDLVPSTTAMSAITGVQVVPAFFMLY